MAIQFDCPACGGRTQAPEELAGRKARCPLCEAVIQVPRPAAAAEAPPPAPTRAGAADEGAAEARRPCPMCGEMILANAVKCRFCDEVFDPELRRADRKRRGDVGGSDLTTGEYVLAFLCSGIGCIVGIVWMIQGKPKGTKMFGISFLMVIVWNVLRFVVESALRH